MVNQLIQHSPWLPFSEVKYVFKPVKEVKVLSSFTSHTAGQAEGGFPICTANNLQVSDTALFSQSHAIYTKAYSFSFHIFSKTSDTGLSA